MSFGKNFIFSLLLLGNTAIFCSEFDQSAFGGDVSQEDLATTERDLQLFQCCFCDKEPFSDALRLFQHLQQHVPVEPFMCRQCPTGFTEERYLAAHMKRHDAEKTFYCDRCNKSFFYKCDFKDHINRHGEKNFLCRLCGNFFPNQGAFDDHIALQHRVTTH